MRTLNRILLVSDRSASTESALLYATALARQSQASILVMQVVETGVASFSRWTDIFRSTAAQAETEAEGRETLARLAANSAFNGLDVQYVLDRGHPVDRVTDMAPQVDLIVMGMGDAGTAEGQAEQRRAREIAHGSAAPVLLIPPGGGAADVPDPQASGLTWQRLLLAIDLAGYAPQAIAIATELATAHHASLLALQVLNPQKASGYPVSAGEGMHHNIAGLKVLLAKRLGELLPDVSEGPPYQREVVEGEAAVVIAEHMAAYRADLVIMSAHAYGTMKKLFTPSTIDAILAEATCPLLTVPFPRSAIG